MGLTTRFGLIVGVLGASACASLLGDFDVKDTPGDGGADGPALVEGGGDPDAQSEGGADGEAGAPNDLLQVDVGGDAPTTDSGHQTCVLTAGGNVRCFGANHIGQLGRAPAPAAQLPPGGIDVPALVNFTTISLSKSRITNGTAFGCALDVKQRAWCWGSNLQGELGRATSDTSPHPQAQPISEDVGLPPVTGVSSISAGARHTCYVGQTSNRAGAGNVYCFGGDVACTVTGQVDATGNCPTETTIFASPLPVTGVPKSFMVAAGAANVCALDDARSQVVCWGSNKYATLGRGPGFGPITGSPGVVDLPRTTRYVELVMGAAFGCVLTDTKRVMCWGQNNAGQLGPAGGETLIATPVFVDALAGSDHLTAGTFNLCGYRLKSTTEKIACLGIDDEGQLAIAVPANPQAPHPTPSLIDITDVVSMSMGSGHACAIGKKADSNGKRPDTRRLYCWGKNNAGQSSPTQVGQRIIDPREVVLGP